MNAESLLQAGDLKACKQQLFSEIKQSPSDVKLRIFLFQLSCINSDWERALNQLEVLRDLDDSTLALVNTYQQLIQCEQKRAKVMAGDIKPTCFGEPSPWLAYYVEAFEQYCKGHADKAFELISLGADNAPSCSGTIDNDQAFDWLCDGDLRFGPTIEVIVNGGYYWLPLDNVQKIDFEPVEDLRDLVWRPAHLTLKNNGKLIVFIPVRYPINANTTDEQLLARTCEWYEPIANFYIGNGQRVFLTPDNEYSILNITSIHFNET